MSAGTSVAGERWLDEQLAQLSREHPALARLGAHVLRHRVALLTLAGALFAGAVDAIIGSDNDLPGFAHAAHVLTSAHPLDALADPSVQVGPSALALVLVFAALGRWAGVAEAVAATAGLAALTTYGILRVSAEVRRLDVRGAVIRDLGLGAGFILGPLAAAALFGQIAELLVAVGLIAVGQLAARRHDLAAGALLGLCASVKLWGLLGLPLLLIAATPRSFARRVSATIIVSAASFAPFVLGGHFATLEYAWRIDPSAPLGLVAGGDSFGWPLRLAQAAFVCAVGALLVRRRAEPWLVVAGLVAARMLTDPARFSYYGASLVACLLVGLWPRYVSRWTWFGPLSVVVSVALTVGDYLTTGLWQGVPRDLLIVATLVWIVGSAGRPSIPSEA